MTGREPGGQAPPDPSEDESTPAAAEKVEVGVTTRRTETTKSESEAGRSVRRVRASDVLGPRGILQIEHEGEVYTLRVTRNNRLILTK